MWQNCGYTIVYYVKFVRAHNILLQKGCQPPNLLVLPWIEPASAADLRMLFFLTAFCMCVTQVVSMCEDASVPDALWDAWRSSGDGIRHVALTGRDRCAFVSFIRRIRLEMPSFRVLDIGAVGFPWSIHAGVADVIFDFQATNTPNCFSKDEMSNGQAERCCETASDDCFDKLFTRERCCRGRHPLFLGMIDGDVTNAAGAGWAKMFLGFS